MTPATATAKAPTMEQLESAFIRLGYTWFNEGNYNLNLVGVRTRDNSANTFNDWLCVAFYADGRPHLFCFEATTDPGLYWRENPLNIDGTAIVKPGQYRGLWQLGLHQGRYQALVQKGPVQVYRDNNLDTVLDVSGPVQQGFFGINLHRATAHGESKQVDKWSAGCQVLANTADFGLLLSLCQQARNRYGNGFTYTLLEEGDL
jgi:hypothetical protein